MENKNPYAENDGSPIKGKESQFFEWARKNELEKRKSLSAERQKELADADKHLADKMNS